MDKIEKIIWTEDGINSFEEIVRYISHDSEFYASNFARRLLLAIERLEIFPRSGRIVPEYNNPDIRELIYQNYRIVYKISDKAVYIALIIHGTNDLSTTTLRERYLSGHRLDESPKQELVSVGRHELAHTAE